MLRRGHELMERLAALPFPTVAAIHGACLGGGLELGPGLPPPGRDRAPEDQARASPRCSSASSPASAAPSACRG